MTYIIHIKICILIILLVVLIIICKQSKNIESYENVDRDENKLVTPKVIYQTYSDKSKIPQKVYANIRKYAPDYKHIILDDYDCIKFLQDNYPKSVLNAFNTLIKGAHKADLVRYCLLYKYGGVYLDIKTELIMPINKIFTNNYLYSVIAKNKKSIYQGIISTPPNNPIFKILINHIILHKNITRDYLIFTRQFYKQLNILCNKPVKNGYNKNLKSNIDIYLFEEICSKNIYECYDGLDRYRLCCHVYDNNKKIIKTRYSDYPWN